MSANIPERRRSKLSQENPIFPTLPATPARPEPPTIPDLPDSPAQPAMPKRQAQPATPEPPAIPNQPAKPAEIKKVTVRVPIDLRNRLRGAFMLDAPTRGIHGFEKWINDLYEREITRVETTHGHVTEVNSNLPLGWSNQ